jgi:hypothetical protein
MRKTWTHSSLLPGFLTLALISTAAAQGAARMTNVEGDSLSGHHVILPNDASGKIAVLIFGFTKASKVATTDSGKRISNNFKGQSDFVLYQLPVLEEVPRLFRGMAISGMRKGVPEEMYDHFVPILNGEAELKKLVSYKEPDDAYMVVLNRAGEIAGQIHGPFTDAANSQLRAQIASLSMGPK